MRDYEAIKGELARTKQAYNEAVDTQPAPKLRELTDRIDALLREAQDVLTEGAISCPNCKLRPHAMERPVVVNQELMSTYEIGCLYCRPREEPHKPDQDPKLAVITEPRTRGMTIEAAVRAWNEGKRVQRHETRS